jgi:hypothetical protein
MATERAMRKGKSGAKSTAAIIHRLSAARRVTIDIAAPPLHQGIRPL